MGVSVSVVLCTYNGAGYIGSQLESLSNQTRLPSELVIQDDGSSDDTLAIIHEFAATAPFPVRIFKNQERLGFAANFLSATRHANCEIVAFCDQDDVWLPRKLEVCVEPFSELKVQAVIHSARLIDSDGKDLGGRYPGFIRNARIDMLHYDPWFAPPGFAIVCRRTLVSDFDWNKRPICHLDPKQGPKPHDQWIYFLASAIGSVALLAEDLALYRQHGKNAAGAPDDSMTTALQRSSSAGAHVYRSKALFARDWAQAYENLSRQHHATYKSAFLAGAKLYNGVAASEDRRADLYLTKGRFHKMRRGYKSLFAGDYRARKRGGMGLRALTKDLVVSIMHGDQIS